MKTFKSLVLMGLIALITPYLKAESASKNDRVQFTGDPAAFKPLTGAPPTNTALSTVQDLVTQAASNKNVNARISDVSTPTPPSACGTQPKPDVDGCPSGQYSTSLFSCLPNNSQCGFAVYDYVCLNSGWTAQTGACCCAGPGCCPAPPDGLCGNGVCDSDENCSNCPADCPSPAASDTCPSGTSEASVIPGSDCDSMGLQLCATAQSANAMCSGTSWSFPNVACCAAVCPPPDAGAAPPSNDVPSKRRSH
jgi:hypothetical protein